jgi:hypothetical protein
VFLSFGKIDIAAELREIKEWMMATNDDLTDIRNNLAEASTELTTKIDELTAQLGDQADPALVADIKARAAALADIVPDSEPDAPPADAGQPTE